jgi:hypothetical protein
MADSFFAHPTAVIDEGCEIGAGTKNLALRFIQV